MVEQKSIVLEELDLTERLKNCLRSANLKTTLDLARTSTGCLLYRDGLQWRAMFLLRNFGENSHQLLCCILKRYGVQLPIVTGYETGLEKRYKKPSAEGGSVCPTCGARLRQCEGCGVSFNPKHESQYFHNRECMLNTRFPKRRVIPVLSVRALGAPARKERDHEIVKARNKGEAYGLIGKRFGLSASWVQAIYEKNKLFEVTKNG